jgi:LacI family fructose operon transcriptional repressor
MSARTLADIARLAGVSRTTASYVVNGKAEKHRISEQTIARVMAVVEAHSFQVDAQAAALRRGATRSLGLIIPDLENSSYARLAKLIESGARDASYYVFIACSEDEPDTERQLARQLRAKRCDALIVASCLPADDLLYAELLAAGLPIIGLDRPMDSNRFCWVASSNENAARTLTESIVSQATADVLWLDALPALSITRRRRAGFATAVAGAAPATRVHYLTGERYDYAAGRSLMLGIASPPIDC